MRKQFIAASFALCVLAGTFARANIIWSWSAFGENESGTFTTTGSNASPLAAGNYTIIDAAITQSLELPAGSISGGQYVARNTSGAAGPYFITWNGSDVTDIDATDHNGGVNGLILDASSSQKDAAFGADFFGNNGPGRFEFSDFDDALFRSGNDLSTTPNLSVPEPGCLSLIALAATITLPRRHRGGR